MSEDRFIREVIRVDQSPMNAQRWALELKCGHEVWVTTNRRPLRQTTRCERCATEASR